MAQKPIPKNLLRNQTSSYVPQNYNYNASDRLPRFSSWYLEEMLRDSRISFGLKMIKGPLQAKSRFFVKDDKSGDGDDVSPMKQFIIETLTRFWRNSSSLALTAIDWGWNGSEVLFNYRNNQLQFDRLKALKQRDVRIVTKNGRKAGMFVRNNKSSRRTFLNATKTFWNVHNHEEHPWYGQTQCRDAFGPWIEMISDGGARDIRRLYYYKHSFTGPTGYFPPDGDQIDAEGNRVPNLNFMINMLENKRAGGYVALPDVRDPETGERVWSMDEGGAGGTADVLAYPADLRREMFEGLGIPTEVLEASETGSGYAGRMVPQDAFYSSLQKIANELISNFDEQIMRPLLYYSLGMSDPDYEIIPFGLIQGTTMQEKLENGSIQGTMQERLSSSEQRKQAQNEKSISAEQKKKAQFSLVM
jgi:hypothetical protein